MFLNQAQPKGWAFFMITTHWKIKIVFYLVLKVLNQKNLPVFI